MSSLIDETEVIETSATGGRKGSKLARLGSIDPVALLKLAEVSGYGAQKYDAFNFLRGYDWSLSFDAMQRHALKFWAGEDLDPESGLPHIGHAAWHCLSLLSFSLRELGVDDRYRQPGAGGGTDDPEGDPDAKPGRLTTAEQLLALPEGTVIAEEPGHRPGRIPDWTAMRTDPGEWGDFRSQGFPWSAEELIKDYPVYIVKEEA